MRRVFASMIVGVAVIGTTVWAQQEEPPPASASAGSTTKSSSEPKVATAPSPDSRPATADTVPSTNAGANPARPDLNPLSGRASSPARASARSQGDQSRGSGAAGPIYNTTGQQSYPMSSGMAGPAYSPANPGYNTYAPAGGNVFAPVNMNQTPYGSYAVPTPYSNVGLPPGVHTPSREDYDKAVEFGKTLESLRKAKTDEERDEIRKKLNDIVSEQLDNDIDQREKRLADIEARAKELREQLQQRKQSKAEIQKLVMMLIENPQGGLGLPSSFMNMINQPTYYSQPTVQSIYQPATPYTPQPASTYSAQ